MRKHLRKCMFINKKNALRCNHSAVIHLQENLRNWIQDPNSIKPGNIMAAQGVVYTNPDRKLTEGEISALVGYLTTLK